MIQQKSKLEWVEDQLSQKHKLTKELGRGGQGVVYKTSDPELLVKMSLKNHKEITDEDEIEQFQKQFEKLYFLPLNNKMHITRPLYLLKEKAGYVMQMMQDMQPIGEWLPQINQSNESFSRPKWISEDVPLESAYSLAMYAKSGGTKRRLELLAQASIELLRLHSVGVVFMDVSPNNIYCSIEPEYSEVWMIDADNLCFEQIDAKSSLITPQYGAPEIVKGESGSRVISDTYSLALLAFKILTMSGAFDGKKFYDQDEDDWATDGLSLESQAEQGMLPFIFDAEDDSNSQTNGLPAELVLTPHLLKFFRDMFGDGRIESWKRPSLHSFPRLLARAADLSIQCSCGMSFYYQPSSSNQTCPYCEDQHKEILVVNSYFYTSKGISDLAWTCVSPFINEQNLWLPMRLSGCFEIDKHKTPMFEINQIEQDWFISKAAMNIKVDVVDDNSGRFIPLTGQLLLERQKLKDGVQLYLHAPYSMIIEIKVHKNNAI